MYSSQALRGPRRLPGSLLPFSLGGRVAHDSHELFVFKGLVFCMRCGLWASHRLLKLVAACRPAKGRSGGLTLGRILEGKLPSGLPAWPADVAMAGGVQLQL